MKEQIVTGKKFRILADVTSRLWHVISFWTKAQDVEFNDGTNAQSKLGNIAGISDSLTSTASNVAASAKAVKVLNDKIVNQIDNLNGQIASKNNTIYNLNGQLNSATEGFDAIYNAIVAQGTTPAGKAPAQLVSAVGSMSPIQVGNTVDSALCFTMYFHGDVNHGEDIWSRSDGTITIPLIRQLGIRYIAIDGDVCNDDGMGSMFIELYDPNVHDIYHDNDLTTGTSRKPFPRVTYDLGTNPPDSIKVKGYVSCKDTASSMTVNVRCYKG